MAVVKKDREVTISQLRLLAPRVVWVQGIVAHARAGKQIRREITDRVVKQNISSRRTAEATREEIAGVVEELRACLSD